MHIGYHDSVHENALSVSVVVSVSVSGERSNGAASGGDVHGIWETSVRLNDERELRARFFERRVDEERLERTELMLGTKYEEMKAIAQRKKLEIFHGIECAPNEEAEIY